MYAGLFRLTITAQSTQRGWVPTQWI